MHLTAQLMLFQVHFGPCLVQLNTRNVLLDDIFGADWIQIALSQSAEKLNTM